MTILRCTRRCLFFLTCCGLVIAQTVNLASIRGTVTDPAAAIIVNAQVSLLNLDTNSKRNAATNQNGDFELQALQPGRYRLTIVNAGFDTFEANDITVESGETRRIDVALTVGQVSTKVSVTAGAAVISTENAKVEETVTSNQYVDAARINVTATFLPQMMLTTLPLVQSTGSGFGAVWAGQATSQIQQGQDGITSDGFANQLNDILDADTIVVTTVLPSAEVARVGYFNQVTKSGSNTFHGRIFYWNVNPALKAREFFQATKAKTFKDTQSVAVSGPILKNKVFFYAAANGAITPSATTYIETVPTAQMRAGNFSQSSSTVKDPVTGVPFPGNIIPATRLNPLALAVNNYYLPAPNVGGPNLLANNYTYTFPYPQDNYAYYKGIHPDPDLPDIVADIKAVCVKDHLGLRGQDNFPVPGSGQINHEEVFRILFGAGFNGPIAVERIDGTDKMANMPAELIDQRIAAARNYLVPLLDKITKG